MSDLISRSELYNLPIYKFGVSMLSAEEYIKVSDIEKMPTAYDIDKVISKIRRASGNGYRDIDGDYVPPMIETKEAIEIVKQGDVTDDVCEWTLDGVYLHSPHKPLVSCVTDENYRYYYCPVCGKKIKVVE